MRTETEDLLRRLEDAEWLTTVGQPLPADLKGSAVTVSSWQEAIVCCSSADWGSFTLEQQNQLTMYLHGHAGNRYRAWNDTVRAVKQRLEPLVEKKLSPAGPWGARHGLRSGRLLPKIG